VVYLQSPIRSIATRGIKYAITEPAETEGTPGTRHASGPDRRLVHRVRRCSDGLSHGHVLALGFLAFAAATVRSLTEAELRLICGHPSQARRLSSRRVESDGKTSISFSAAAHARYAASNASRSLRSRAISIRNCHALSR